MNNQNSYKELFKGYIGENPHKEVDWGEDVGKERIWSMTDEELEKENDKS